MASPNQPVIGANRQFWSKRKLRELATVPFYANTFYLVLNTVFLSLFGFAASILTTRLFSAEDVGLAAAIITAMNLLMSLSTLGLQFGLIRFLPAAPDRKGMLNSGFTIATILTVVITLIFVAGLRIWSPNLLFIQNQPLLLAAFFVFTLTYALGLLQNNVFTGGHRSDITFFLGLTMSVLRVGLIVTLAVFGVFGIVAANGLAMLVSLLAGFIWYLPRMLPGYRPHPVIRRDSAGLVRFSLGNHLANLLLVLPSMLLPLIVVNALGAEPNAYFYVAWTVASSIQAVTSNVATALLVEGSHDEVHLFRYAGKALLMTLLLLAVSITAVFLLSEFILQLFGQGYSENAYDILSLLVLSMLPACINQLYVTVMRVNKNLKGIVAVSGISCALTIGVSYLLMPALGLIGVGVACIAGQGAVALWSVWYLYVGARRKAAVTQP